MKPSSLYPLIYDFLLKCGHSKTAKVFTKDLNVDKNELLNKEQFDLVEIFSNFKEAKSKSKLNNTKHKKVNYYLMIVYFSIQHNTSYPIYLIIYLCFNSN